MTPALWITAEEGMGLLSLPCKYPKRGSLKVVPTTLGNPLGLFERDNCGFATLHHPVPALVHRRLNIQPFSVYATGMWRCW